MIPLTAARVAEVVGAVIPSDHAESRVLGVAIDSRTAGPGDAFFAIVGSRDDGHRYLMAAAEAGASVIVIERDVSLDDDCEIAILRVADTTDALQQLSTYVRNRVSPRVAAITGSIGKTTTKVITHRLAAAHLPTHASPGNFNNKWGLPLALLGLEQHHRAMIAELGMSAPGEIRALAAIARPEIGAIINVAPAHMEFFRDLEEVAAAKGELADALPESGTLIVNADDPRTAALGARAARHVADIRTFGLREGASVTVAERRLSDTGWKVRLSLPDHVGALIDLPLPGEHSLYNYLAAVAVARALDVPVEVIEEVTPDLALPDMRGQIHGTAAGVTVFDDSYNASPAAMIRALDTLASLPADGRKFFAAGDMLELGEWTEDAHREVGLHAADLGVDVVVTVGMLARDIGHGAREGGLHPDSVIETDNSDDAAETVVPMLRSGDLVLVKGSRGVHMEVVTRAILAACGADAAGRSEG